MKTILKYFLLLIALSLIGFVIYQNLDYFLTRNTLTVYIEKFNWTWTTPAIENVIFFDVCFLAGLLLASGKGMLVKWDLNKTIKSKEDEINALHQKNEDLKSELDFFQHDPYIKKGLEKKALENIETSLEELPEPADEEDPQDIDSINPEETVENNDATLKAETAN